MNPHLQNILDRLQPNNNLTAEEKDSIIKSLKDADKDFSITAFKLDRTEKVKRTTSILLEETIEELENKRKAVEAQNRELEIEAALERVRAVAMGMKQPPDMLEICKTISQQLSLLNVKEIRNVQTAIFYESKSAYMNYEYYAKHDKTFITETTYTNNKIHNAFADQMLKGKGEFFVTHIKGDEVKNWIAYQKTTNVFIDTFLETASSLNYYWFSLGPVALGISTYEPLKEEDTKLFKRFLNVFGLSYTRYLDIEKAIAQAREAQVEVSLERVRANTMAMHQTSELQEVIHTVHKELLNLHLSIDGGSFVAINNEINDELICWGSGGTANTAEEVHVPHFNMPFCTNIIKGIKAGPGFFTEEFSAEEKHAYFKQLFNQKPWSDTDSERKAEMLLSQSGYTRSVAVSNHTTLFIINHHGRKFTDAENDILKRFAKVFEQTYTRFLDLQKAEAQAREAQIQLALERVRAKTMAMQKPSEFVEVINVIGEQFVHLGFDIEWVNFGSNGLNVTEGIDIWNFAVIPGGQYFSGRLFIPLFDHPVFTTAAAALDTYQKTGNDFFEIKLNKNEKDSWLDHLYANPAFKDTPDELKAVQYNKPGYATSNILLKDTWLSIGKFDTASFTDEQNAILQKFAKAFGLAHTRFLDLQKAEAQAREAQIEAAVENIRSRSLAMHHSNEVKEVVKRLFEKMKELGFFQNNSVMIVLPKNDYKDVVHWTFNENFETMEYYIPAFDHPVSTEASKAWKNGEKIFEINLNKQEKDKFLDLLFSETDYSKVPDDFKQYLYSTDAYSQIFAFEKHCGLLVDTFTSVVYTKTQKDIVTRFAKVFEQAYIRFLDLQKAEAQAREAQIQLALERVRARTMAMQQSTELPEAANLLFQQIQSLGMPAWSAGYCIWNEDKTALTAWMSSEGVLQPPFNAPTTEDELFIEMRKGAEQGKSLHVVEMGGEKLVAHYQYMRTLPVVGQILDSIIETGHPLPTFQIMHQAYFSKGFLLFITYEPVQEAHDIFIRFAQVFEQTYTRFLDLQKAEAQSRESQIQLALERVRARTMAMQKSDELANVATILFQQVKALGVPQWACGFCIWDIGDTECKWYPGSPDGKILTPTWFPLTGHPVFRIMDESRKRGDELYILEKEGELQADHYRYMMTLPGVRELLQDLLDAGFTIPAFQIDHYANFAYGNLIFITYEHFPEMHDIFKRFAQVFDQTYTRFLDLQKAEAQAREAQIQLALERVRARTMAMQKSDELQEVVHTLFEKLNDLDIELDTVFLIIFTEGSNDTEWWLMNSRQQEYTRVKVNYNEQKYFHALMEAREKGEGFFSMQMPYEDKNEMLNYLFNHTDFSLTPEDQQKRLLGMECGVFSVALTKNFAIHLTRYSQKIFTEEENNILRRFTKVFDQSYTRFLDLQKAEAQAKEAQIELALERVRSKTTSMHSSQDVGEAVGALYDEVEHLKTEATTCGIAIIHENGNMETWAATKSAAIKNADGKRQLHAGFPDTSMHPFFIAIVEAWKNGHPNFSCELEGDSLVAFYKVIGSTLSHSGNFDITALPPKIFNNVFFFREGALFVESIQELSATSSQIFTRFAAVFGQTYRRYLDLQKAEAQAKEAQVEAALEKVRSSTLAMHKSEELPVTAAVLFGQLSILGKTPDRITIGIMNEAAGIVELWATDQSGNEIHSSFTLDITEKTTVQKLFNGWKAGLKSLVIDLTGEELKNWLNYIRHTGLIVKDEHFKNRRVHNVAFFSHGFLNISTLEPLPGETMKVLERFATVYSLTYTRFLDLKKAEAQAREAQIEAALERVRGKAMGMHNSQDLTDTIGIFYKELHSFSLTPRRCGVGLFKGTERVGELFTWNTTEQGESLELTGTIKIEGHPVLDGVYEHWLTQQEYHPVLRGNEIKEYYKILRPQIAFPDYNNSDVLYGYFFFFTEGGVYAWTEKQMEEAELQIYRRFTSVLSLTYKRYIDLKLAEVHAKEAVKQAALDRIRADIASMRTVDDLDRITPLIWNELTILGIPFVRCGVFLMDDTQQLIHTFLSTPDGKAIAAFHLPYDTPGNLGKVLSHWQEKKNYIDHWSEDEFISLADILVKQGAIANRGEYLDSLPHGGFHLHFLPFLQGMLYVGNITPLDEEEIKLLQSVADAFSTAYARYEDFNKLEAAKKRVDATLTELQATQRQLIQSEKMASLGELTAGIAHEIQNPLNFVNNFSEVSNEMVDEMKEALATGNLELVTEITDDIKQNLEKINHHGKRADAIVKGMLQHSRKSEGKKEPTDINALCDEYLRLAYHGLRAKDKGFNADFKTDFDETIGKINVVPQDLGRVLLNIINNAFYAVNEKLQAEGGPYAPTVTIVTKKLNDKVEIRISDNGNGIPQNIVDKIFQPFFTTKPTGSGTGLGLSLAYDIVKAHGGEIKVETKEDKGTTFSIQLPA